MTSVDQLEELITKKFPGVWIKPGSHMGYSDKSLISGEGSEHKGKEVFNYWTEDWKETTYRMKVLIEFADFVEKHGYYVEFIDSGTVAISPE
jgi:hypothetical protein